MVNLLTRLFVKDRDDLRSPQVRTRYGTLSSVVGILANFLLFVVKMVAGTLCGSLSIRADAVNNLSDAGSSLVSLVSFKISAKPADREHPFGHARMEYVASMIVSFLILLIGVELVKGAVEKLLAPVLPVFHTVAVVILLLSVAFKLWLWYFNRSIGKKIDSDVLRATAADALADALSTSGVLVATAVAPLLPEAAGKFIDPVMSILVATLIFVAGIRILNDTKNSILGAGPDAETVETVEAVVAEYPEALGIHDLVIHNYGAGHTLVSLHIEVDGKKDIFHSHDVVDLIERRLRAQHGIECCIHLDPIVVDDPLVNEWHERLEKLVCTVDERLRIHDFRMVPGTTHTNLIFDVAAPFELSMSDSDVKAAIAKAVGEEAPNYFTVITVDRV